MEDAGIYFRYKVDKKLFRRNAEELKINECQFATNPTLLAGIKREAEMATTEYMHVAKNFGPTFSISKTKFMAVGREK